VIQPTSAKNEDRESNASLEESAKNSS
jgi:hypothetical protein